MRLARSWTGKPKHHVRLVAAASAAAFSLFLLAGCGGRAPKIEKHPSSPEGARALLGQLSDATSSIDADFSFGFQALFYKGTFFGQSQLKMPDQFAATLRAPLGIKAGEVVLSEGFYELSLGDGTMMSGGVDSLDIEALTGLPLPTDDLLVLFDPMPRPPSVEYATLDFSIVGDDSLWLWTLDEQGMEHQIEIAPGKGQVLRETWSRPDGSMILKKEYRDHDAIKGIPVARKVKLAARGRIPVVVELTFNSIELDPRWDESPFKFKWTTRP
ncbi:hypothetical protein KQI63_01540 [bacterium]|nr:hypothetical protein [bacterium]